MIYLDYASATPVDTESKGFYVWQRNPCGA